MAVDISLHCFFYPHLLIAIRRAAAGSSPIAQVTDSPLLPQSTAAPKKISLQFGREFEVQSEISFLGVNAFPVATYGCESWAMTSGDKKRMMHSNCGFIEYCSGCHGWRRKRKMGVGQDWVCFEVAKEYDGEADEVHRPHRPKNCIANNTDYRGWKVSGEGVDLQRPSSSSSRSHLVVGLLRQTQFSSSQFCHGLHLLSFRLLTCPG